MANNFFLPKLNSVLRKNYPLMGRQRPFNLFCQVAVEEKYANMAETKQKPGRKLAIYEEKGECWPCSVFELLTIELSNSFLSNCQFLFCQATHFCSAKLNIFSRVGQGPKGPPAQEHLWLARCLLNACLVLVFTKIRSTQEQVQSACFNFSAG